MSNYKLRLIDEKIGKKLKSTGGILLKGARYCGKTTTAQFHAASVVRFDASEQIREQATLMPQVVLQGETPRLIDEWQLVPSIWNAARHEIDLRAAKGQFILTGSASPSDDISAHTGAGRFARLTLRTMSLAESGDSTKYLPKSHSKNWLPKQALLTPRPWRQALSGNISTNCPKSLFWKSCLHGKRISVPPCSKG
jgi:predicted AAA+ superfamily ATPase